MNVTAHEVFKIDEVSHSRTVIIGASTITAKESGMSENKSAFQLTWNPSNVPLGINKIGEVVRWSCVSKQPKIGDDIYLVRVGVEPRGIVVKGVVVKESFSAEDWKDPTKVRDYVELKVQEIRENCADGLLGIDLLNIALPQQSWSHQGSGIAIKDALPTLEKLWEIGRGKHTLKQLVEWFQQNESYRRDDWLPHYTKTVDLIKNIATGKQAIGENELSIIWKETANGIASVGQGVISQSDFDNIKPLLFELTKKIITKPNNETMKEVEISFLNAKTGGKIKKIYYSAINRVFSGAAPTLYTSIANTEQCKKLLSILIKSFQLGEDNSDIDGWIGCNTAIKKCMEQAKLQPDKVNQNNIAMWTLYDLKKTNKLEENDNVESKKITEKDSEKTLMNYPLNQILYGPPGTGKTYNAINKALEILDPDFLESNKDDRKAITSRYQQLAKEGRVCFVTFHQSFSYEDFIEGISASNGDDQINYSVEPGIFKKMCERASTGDIGVSFQSALNKFIEQVAEQPLTIKTPTGKNFKVFYGGDGKRTLTCVPESSKEQRELPANIETINKVLHNIIPETIYCESYVRGIANYIKEQSGLSITGSTDTSPFSPGQTFNDYTVISATPEILTLKKPRGGELPYPMSIISRLADYVRKNEITVDDIKKGIVFDKVDSNLEKYMVNGYNTMLPPLVQYVLDNNSAGESSTENNKPYVLIIDEINRGNISKIFGELISLIEPSKRRGEDEALTVTLPYSKEEFSVPNNLYIIGTMNTADRSLANIDIALRRRFIFDELAPNPEELSDLHVDGINIKNMLEMMNKRIEWLYDRDHTIGHAYFIPLKHNPSLSHLSEIFARQILPLLEEYFFEDWQRIRQVLNDESKSNTAQFIQRSTDTTESLFGKSDVGISDKVLYRKNPDLLNMSVEAFKRIYE